jgi:hypothetical protein
LLSSQRRQKHYGRQGDRSGHQGQSGSEALEAAHIETAESDAAGPAPLSFQHCGYDEAGDHKKNVHTHKSAASRQAGVIRDNEQHGYSPQSLNIGPPVALSSTMSV